MEKNEFGETIIVDTQTVSCNGGNGASEHPNVYLDVGSENKVSCPYCCRLFVFGTVPIEGEDH